jgi:hypothetical protein
MTRDQCPNHAKPNRRRDRAADAWPTCVIEVRAPGTPGQIQARLHSQDSLAPQTLPLYRPGRLDGEHFHKSRGH